MEIKGAYELEHLPPESQLSHIKEAIKIHTKLTALEIFKIGRLLTLAKQICWENKISFGKWFQENCKFSYKTAINFMHVYKYSLAIISIAINIPPSILYKICTPGFPEELREFYLNKGTLIVLRTWT